MTTLLDILTGPGADRSALTPASDAVRAQVDLGVVAAPASNEINSALADALDEPIGNLVHRAWRADRAIDAARERTRTGPERREVLRTLEHTVGWSKEITVELRVGGSVMYEVPVEVALDVEATAVHVVVEDGEVASISPGAAIAKVEVSVGGRAVMERRLANVDLTPEPMAPPPRPADPPRVVSDTTRGRPAGSQPSITMSVQRPPNEPIRP